MNIKKCKTKKTGIILITIILVITLANTTTSAQNTVIKTRLTNAQPSAGSPSIAINDDIIHVVWYNDFFPISANSDIYYKKSTDGGKTWNNETRLTNANSELTDPIIGVNGKNIHVVWQDFRHKDEDSDNREIYYKVSRDEGNTWSNDIRLTSAPKRSSEPSLYVDGDSLYVVWMDYRIEGSEIYIKISEDNGYTWSNDTRLTFNPAPSYMPVVGAYKNNVHVVWQDNREGGWGVYYKKSTNYGKNWSEDIRLSGQGYTCDNPSMFVDEERIYIVWVDHRASKEIYFLYSEDNGDIWSEDKRLTNTDYLSLDPYITMYDNRLYAAWEDYRNEENSEIYYKIGLNNGDSWTGDIRLTDSNSSRDPSSAVNNEGIHLLCIDDVDYTNELMYYQISTNFLGITSLDFSNTSVHRSDSIDITIEGVSSDEDIENVECSLQYRSPSRNWTLINADFVLDHWEAKFTFDENAELGLYDFKARLTSSSGEKSYWFESLDVVELSEESVEDGDNEGDSPGFELILFVFSVVFIFFIHKKRFFKK